MEEIAEPYIRRRAMRHLKVELLFWWAQAIHWLNAASLELLK
jgi:hypothetical protein